MAQPRVLAITVNYNGGHWVVDAVASLKAQEYPTDVLVIDNASTDGSAGAIRSAHPDVEVVETGQNLGSVAGYNYALRYTGYSYIFLLNPDAYAEPSCVGKLVDLMEGRPNLAVLGPAIVEYDEPDRVQAFDPRIDFLMFPLDRWEGLGVNELPDVDFFSANYACAAAVIFRADVFARLGGMDERFFMFVEEPDYCWRARLIGYEIAVTPRVRVRHFGGVAATVGGKAGNYVTSLRRIYLRERNSLMMAIKCYALPTLVVYLFLLLATLSLESLALIVLGRAAIAREYWHAVRDATRQWKSLMESRRVIQKTRTVSEWTVLRTFAPGYAKLVALKQRRMPKIADWQRTAS